MREILTHCGVWALTAALRVPMAQAQAQAQARRQE